MSEEEKIIEIKTIIGILNEYKNSTDPEPDNEKTADCLEWLLNSYKKIQQENKKLKEKLSKANFENTYTNIVHSAFQIKKKEKRYYENILNELESWLVFMFNTTQDTKYLDVILKMKELKGSDE